MARRIPHAYLKRYISQRRKSTNTRKTYAKPICKIAVTVINPWGHSTEMKLTGSAGNLEDISQDV